MFCRKGCWPAQSPLQGSLYSSWPALHTAVSTPAQGEPAPVHRYRNAGIEPSVLLVLFSINVKYDQMEVTRQWVRLHAQWNSTIILNMTIWYMPYKRHIPFGYSELDLIQKVVFSILNMLILFRFRCEHVYSAFRICAAICVFTAVCNTFWDPELNTEQTFGYAQLSQCWTFQECVWKTMKEGGYVCMVKQVCDWWKTWIFLFWCKGAETMCISVCTAACKQQY